MKHYSWMAVSALLLGFMMLNLTSCSKDEENGGTTPTEKEKGGKDDDKPVVVPDVVVTVDDSGQADGGHRFQRIDDTSFYIDDIKYTAEQGDLVVSGYDQAFFQGAAVIISTLKYRGHTMNVTSIKDGAFEKCTVMTSVTIPSSVTSIGRFAFYGCSGLTSVHISDLAAWCTIVFPDYASNPLSSAHHLFLNQKEITNLIIPDGVTAIQDNTFHGCSGLTSVTIPSSVTSIGIETFSGCSGLTSVTIPGSLTSIGEVAFYGCSGLTSVTIPNSVKSIGGAAFAYCSGLTSIMVEKDNSQYDSRDNCNAIIETASNKLIAGCKNTTIPGSVTSIGNEAFSGCSGLTSVTIPGSMMGFGWYAFYGCSGLQHVYCLAVNPPSAGNSLFDETPISSATLHVPAESLDAYKATSPWSEFGSIVAL